MEHVLVDPFLRERAERALAETDRLMKRLYATLDKVPPEAWRCL